MTEAETINLLIAYLDGGKPFVHCRFGDGDVFFATGTGPTLTADGEVWSPELALRLSAAWDQLALAPTLLLGDLDSCDVSDGCEQQWEALLDTLQKIRDDNFLGPEVLVHMEALRAARLHAIPLFRRLQNDPRRKLFIGPARLSIAMRMFDCDQAIVPLGTAHEWTEWAADFALSEQYEIVILAAGRGGKIIQGDLVAKRPELCQIDLGSGIDILIPTGVRRGTDRGVDEVAIRSLYTQAELL